MESHRRSLLKALSWRLLALLITFAVALLLFDDVEVAAKVGVLDSVVKIVIYYVHERAWQKVPFGRRAETRAPGTDAELVGTATPTRTSAR